MFILPTVMDKNSYGHERAYDLYSRMLKDRIVFLNDQIVNDTANSIVAQLLFLHSQDATKDIFLYINSPGGVVSDGLAIYDTMQYISCDVSTICIGTAASMAAVLLAAGAKGKRFILPNSEVMIHQVLGNASGQASDIRITAEHILKTKDRLTRILADHTGQSLEQVMADTDRDNWLDAEEAVKYGIVDQIMVPKVK